MGRDDTTKGACEVWDVGADADESVYECTRCGWSERAETSPGTCPKCGNDLRNTAMPIE